MYKGFEIRGKQLGVVGLGAIGVMVANDAAALGMKVEGHDPFISVDRAWGLSRSVKPAGNINKMFSKSDFITLHMPLTDGTKKFINKDRLDHFKEGSVLLNFARPEIVDENAIISALKKKKLKHYITDFPSEKLLNAEGVIAIPHLGASTEEAETNCALMVVDQIREFLENGNIINSVNFPNCYADRTGDFRLAITNDNIPNMVGQISGLLAEDSLNILEMVNKSRDKIAYNLVDIKGKPKTDLKERLLAIKGVRSVRILK